MPCVRGSHLPAMLALAGALALPCSSAALGAEDPVALTTDGRPIPVAPDVIASNKAGVTVRATRITTPLVVDGQLDESVYADVKPITEYVQQDPHVFFAKVESANLEWSFTVDEAVTTR